MELGVKGEVSKVSINSEPVGCLEDGAAAASVVCQMAGCFQTSSELLWQFCKQGLSTAG